jgi:hypothetical protein
MVEFKLPGEGEVDGWCHVVILLILMEGFIFVFSRMQCFIFARADLNAFVSFL